MRWLAAFALAFLLSGVASASELRIALAEDPDLLDPAQGTSFVGRDVFAAMCDKLVDIAPDMSFVP
jgi:peptide/nickel transport system substrate-binding protein